MGSIDLLGLKFRRNQILMNTPHLATASDDIIHFNTDMASPLKQCTIDFHPKQSGTGTPSPTNIRPISGFSGINVGVPSTYQETDYIQNRSSAYIDTGYIPQGDETFELTFTIAALPANGRWIKLFGCRQDVVETSVYNCWAGITGGQLYPRFGTVNPTASIPISTGDHTLIVNLSSCVLTLDGQTYNFTGSEVSGITAPLYLSDTYRVSSLTSDGTVNYKSFRIYRNNAVVFDCVPCYRISDMVAGMYDMTSKSFFINVGSSAFVRGNEVNSYSIPIDWSNSAGTVYGGNLNLITGELTVTWQMKSAVWGDIITGGPDPSTGYYGGGMIFDNALVKCTSQPQYGVDSITNFTSNVEWKWTDEGSSHHYYISGGTGNRVSIVGTMSHDMVLQVAAKLATPLTYQLDPHQLSSLRGANTIRSDSNGDITIKYWTH